MYWKWNSYHQRFKVIAWTDTRTHMQTQPKLLHSGGKRNVFLIFSQKIIFYGVNISNLKHYTDIHFFRHGRSTNLFFPESSILLYIRPNDVGKVDTSNSTWCILSAQSVVNTEWFCIAAVFDVRKLQHEIQIWKPTTRLLIINFIISTLLDLILFDIVLALNSEHYALWT